jgi:Flp pilus assembly protein TadG
MVEMALILPTFLLLVVGMLDFGMAVYARNALANAARDGARFASVDPNNASCIASVAAQRSTLANLAVADVDVDVASAALGQPVTVSVQSQYQPITPLIGELIGAGSLTLQASATMRIRNVPASPLGCAPPPTAVPATPVPATATPPGTPPAATPTVPAATATVPAATATPVPPTATPAPPTATPCVGPPGQCKKDDN